MGLDYFYVRCVQSTDNLYHDYSIDANKNSFIIFINDES